MEALIQHVRALLVGKVAPDADELKVYDAFKAEFLAQAESIDFNELNQYVRSAQSIMNDANRWIIHELSSKWAFLVALC